jgi:hypothetical protein
VSNVLPNAESSRRPRWHWPRGLAWALSPLAMGVPAAFCIAWAARRLNSVRLAAMAGVFGAATLIATLLLVFGSDSQQDTGSALLTAIGILGATQNLLLRPRLFAATTATSTLSSCVVQAAWNPMAFPAAGGGPADPRNPATWHTPFECDGRDGHEIGMPPRQALLFMVPGIVVTAGCLWLHIYARPLGTGIGLLLVPAFAEAFRAQVIGPKVIYRVWGTSHTFRLDRATGVDLATTKKGKLLPHSLALTGPDSAKPVKITVANPKRPNNPQVRAHFAGWLLRDGVIITPRAHELLAHGPAIRQSRPLRGWTRTMLWLTPVLTVLFVTVAVGLRLASSTAANANAPDIATSASQCQETAPANTSPVARAYLADLNNAYAGWVNVSQSLIAENHDPHQDDLANEMTTDVNLVRGIRTIPFSGPAAATAGQLAATLDDYAEALQTSVDQYGYFAAHEHQIQQINRSAMPLAAELRTELGLPKSRCTYWAP